VFLGKQKRVTTRHGRLLLIHFQLIKKNLWKLARGIEFSPTYIRKSGVLGWDRKNKTPLQGDEVEEGKIKL
jgi:hypothetical protein